MISIDLLFEAVLFGILLGCFYAAVSLGLSVAFGLLDVPYVAHPALLILATNNLLPNKNHAQHLLNEYIVLTLL